MNIIIAKYYAEFTTPRFVNQKLVYVNREIKIDPATLGEQIERFKKEAVCETEIAFWQANSHVRFVNNVGPEMMVSVFVDGHMVDNTCVSVATKDENISLCCLDFLKKCEDFIAKTVYPEVINSEKFKEGCGLL